MDNLYLEYNSLELDATWQFTKRGTMCRCLDLDNGMVTTAPHTSSWYTGPTAVSVKGGCHAKTILQQ